MTVTIPLIETKDGFEMVRDAIVNILALEIANQIQQATDAEKDTTPWEISVFQERSNPWELFRDRDGNVKPVINVWYDTSNTEGQSSNNQSRQTANSTINIDCLASAVTEETDAGQSSGDEAGMLKAQQVARVARRVLMHPKWVQLGLKTVVSQRGLGNRQAYKPISGDHIVEHVCGVQVALRVRHNETVDFETLSASEGALVTIKRSPGGDIVAQMDFDWT